MAHEDHRSNHSVSNSRSNDSGNTFSVFAVGIVLLLLAILTTTSIGGKNPLEGSFKNYPSYLVDEEEYFYNTEDLVSGLEYLHENTNVQLVIMTSHCSWSNQRAIYKYRQMFDDEAHILLVIPTGWISSKPYYSIGSLADSVISDNEMKYLLDRVGNSKDGKDWHIELVSFADDLLSEK